MKPFIPTIKNWTLSNGLQILWNPRPQANSFYMEARIRLGSSHAENAALPHFLEHMVYFSPTQKFSAKEKLYEFSDSLGIDMESDRAETSQYFTRYFGDGDPEDAKDLLLLMAERLFSSKLTDQTFQHEGIRIENEMAMRYDDPDMYFFDILLPSQAEEENSSLVSAVGTLAQAKRVQQKDIQLAYDQYYNPNNTILLLSGPSSMEAKIKKEVFSCFSRVKNKKEATTPKLKPITLKKNNHEKQKKEAISQYHFAFLFPVMPFSVGEEYKLDFLYQTLQGHHSFLQRLKDTTGVYNIFPNYFSLPNTTMVYVYGSTKNKRDIDKIQKGIETEAYTLEKKAFEEAKKKYIRSLLVDFEFDYRTLAIIGDYFIRTGEIITLKDALKNAHSIDLNSAQKLYQDVFQPKNMNVFILEPKQ